MSDQSTTEINDDADDSEDSASEAEHVPVEHGDWSTWRLVEAGVDGQAVEEVQTESVTEPAKVMRIGSMVKQLLEEVRHGTARRGQPRAAGRDLRALGRRAVRGAVARPAGGAADRWPCRSTTERSRPRASCAIAKAQLVGWLEGLFHGIQATLFAQQLAARQQLEQMRQLPPGAMPQMRPGRRSATQPDRPGTYL